MSSANLQLLNNYLRALCSRSASTNISTRNQGLVELFYFTEMIFSAANLDR